MTSRVPIIDVAKGICIVLVVFSHSTLGRSFPELNHALGLFRMPLFFFLSGIFLRETVSLKQAIMTRSDALLKPYLATLLLLLLFRHWMGEEHALSTIKGIVYGNGSTIWWGQLWFLPHLWILHLSSFVVVKYTKILHQSGWVVVTCLLFQILAGAAIVQVFRQEPVHIGGVQILGLPFSADLLLLTSGYFLAGRFFRDHIETFKPQLFLAVIAIAGYAVIALFTAASVDLNSRIYEKWAISTIAAISGSYLAFSLAYLVEKHPLFSRIIRYLGLSTLFILIFHQYFEEEIYKALTRSNIFQNDLIAAAISFVACILVSLTIRLVVVSSSLLSLFFVPFKFNKWLHGNDFTNHGSGNQQYGGIGDLDHLDPRGLSRH